MKKTKLLIGLLLSQIITFQAYGQYDDPYFVGHNNTLLGRGALSPGLPVDALGDQFGTKCTAIGFYSLAKHSTGGYYLYLDQYDGIENTAVGAFSMYNTTLGSFNTSVGNNSLLSNLAGTKNVAIGYESLKQAVNGVRNVAVGYRSMANTTGSPIDNVALGSFALFNVTGPRNIAIGAQAAVTTTTGFDNIAIGKAALAWNNSGTGNVAVGNLSQYSSSTGANNVSLGYKSLYSNLNSNNVAIGRQALHNNTTGYNNIAIGSYAGNSMFTGYNTISIGYNASATSSNSVLLGNSSISSIEGYANFTNISDKRVKTNVEENVPGLEFITQLRPVTYNLDMDAIAGIIGTPDSLRLFEAEQLKAKELQCGFIAQEVEVAANEIDFDFHGVDKPENENDPYGLRYAEFVVPLVKSVQELNEQNETLIAQLNELEDRLNALTQNSETTENTEINSNDLNEKAVLFQNKPNPFSDQSIIEYYLPAQYNKAQLIIVDVNGSVVKTHNIVMTGNGILTLNANELQPGSYVYSLYIENVGVVDSKRLIVT